MSYIIRAMEKGDLPQVNTIDREAFPTQWPPPNYRQELQNRLANYLVAIDDSREVKEAGGSPGKTHSRLIAWLAPWLKHSAARDPSGFSRQFIIGFSGMWLMSDEAHITNIAVAQEYRRKGVGELLLIATIDLSREIKARTMTLEVRASNTAAQNLYHKYGFKDMGVRHGYYLDNREDAIIMSTENINSQEFQEHVRQLRESLARRFGQML